MSNSLFDSIECFLQLRLQTLAFGMMYVNSGAFTYAVKGLINNVVATCWSLASLILVKAGRLQISRLEQTDSSSAVFRNIRAKIQV